MYTRTPSLSPSPPLPPHRPTTRLTFSYYDSARDDATTLFGAFSLASPGCKAAFGGLAVDALLGPASSGPSIMAQYVLRKLSVPQIGYSASSPKLSDSSIFPFFLRAVPSDTLQVVALAELIRHYGWSKVSTISADDAYSLGGIRAFEEIARARKMIISTSLEFAAEQQNVTKQIREIVRAGTRIVVVFASASNMAAVVKEFGRYSDWGPQQGVTFVFSETLKVNAWRRREGGRGEIGGRGRWRGKRGGGGWVVGGERGSDTGRGGSFETVT